MVFPWVPLLRPALDAPLLGFPLAEVVKWGFTTPVQFWIGARFHLGALKALRNGRHAMLCTADAVMCGPRQARKHVHEEGPNQCRAGQ